MGQRSATRSASRFEKLGVQALGGSCCRAGKRSVGGQKQGRPCYQGKPERSQSLNQGMDGEAGTSEAAGQVRGGQVPGATNELTGAELG